jgi:PPP family 3-phenylpropionic acid transporter
VTDGQAAVPGVRLAGFYFVFFAAVGTFLPYWALYLEGIGLDAGAIGALVALGMAVRIVTPNLWGWLADRRGRRMGVIRLGAVVGVVCFALVPMTRDVLALAMVILVYNAFWTAVMPQFEAVTLAHLGPRSARYSRIRLWGSVGFVAASAGVGALLERTGVLVLPWLLLPLMATVALMAFAVAEPRPESALAGAGAPTVAPPARHAVIPFLAACALMQLSHGPYYVFFSIHLERLGYARDAIGVLWALGVVAEVALFAVMPRILARAPVAPLFAGCFALTGVRWLLLAAAPATWPVLVLVQGLHAVSFGAYHALGIALVQRLFAGGRQGRGQALYSSLSFGAGGAAGSALAGWLWAAAGPEVTWTAAAAVAVMGGLVSLRIRAVG